MEQLQQSGGAIELTFVSNNSLPARCCCPIGVASCWFCLPELGMEVPKVGCAVGVFIGSAHCFLRALRGKCPMTFPTPHQSSFLTEGKTGR